MGNTSHSDTSSALSDASADSAATSLSPLPKEDVAATSRDKREQKPCERCGKMFGRAVSKSGIVQGHAAFVAWLWDGRQHPWEGQAPMTKKRCPVCQKVFGQKVLANGKLEPPSYFKKKVHCSLICGSIAAAASRKAQAERRA